MTKYTNCTVRLVYRASIEKLNKSPQLLTGTIGGRNVKISNSSYDINYMYKFMYESLIFGFIFEFIHKSSIFVWEGPAEVVMRD